MLFGVKWVFLKAGSLVNKIGMVRVGYFGGIIRDTSVYPKFSHLLDALMGSVSKEQMDELSRDIEDRAHDTW